MPSLANNVAINNPLVGCVVCCFLILAFGCDRTEDPLIGSNSPRLLKVDTVRIKKVDNVLSTPVYFGVLQPREKAALGFAKAGTIGKLHFKIGQQVRTGDVLAELSQQQLLERRGELQRQTSNTAASGNFQAREQLNQIAADIERGTIVAPFDGIVVENHSFQGGSVSPGQPVVTLYDQAAPNLEFDFPAGIASKIDPANDWQIDINGEQIIARVRYKSPMQKVGGNVRIAFASDLPMQPTWNFGQSVKIEFRQATGKSGFWVPTSALVRGQGGSWSIMQVVPLSNRSLATSSQRITRRVSIDVEQTRGDRALVNGDLQDDGLIVAGGLHRIVAGQAIDSQEKTAVASRAAEPVE